MEKNFGCCCTKYSTFLAYTHTVLGRQLHFIVADQIKGGERTFVNHQGTQRRKQIHEGKTMLTHPMLSRH